MELEEAPQLELGQTLQHKKADRVALEELKTSFAKHMFWPLKRHSMNNGISNDVNAHDKKRPYMRKIE